MEPSGPNGWQPVANPMPSKTAQTSRNRCGGLRPLAMVKRGSTARRVTDGTARRTGRRAHILSTSLTPSTRSNKGLVRRASHSADASDCDRVAQLVAASERRAGVRHSFRQSACLGVNGFASGEHGDELLDTPAPRLRTFRGINPIQHGVAVPGGEDLEHGPSFWFGTSAAGTATAPWATAASARALGSRPSA